MAVLAFSSGIKMRLSGTRNVLAVKLDVLVVCDLHGRVALLVRVLCAVHEGQHLMLLKSSLGDEARVVGSGLKLDDEAVRVGWGVGCRGEGGVAIREVSGVGSRCL